MPDKDRMLTQNELLAMLAIQRRVRNTYGVTIRDEIEAHTKNRMSFGKLYAVLTRLERDGLLSVRYGEPTAERGGRTKRFFALTGKGQRALQGTLSSPCTG